MKLASLLRAAYRSLLRNRMRSLLTSLGVIIGVGAVIVMIGVGSGAQHDVEEQINSLGVNMITIFPNFQRMGGVSQAAGTGNLLTLEDADKLAAEATLVSAVTPVVHAHAQVIGGEGNWNTEVDGVSPQYLDIRAWPLASGEFFTERDVRAKSKVAVLGQTVVDNLFPFEDPIGQMIRIRNTPFRVIGVLSKKGETTWGQDQDDIIIAPSTTVLYRLAGGQFISRIQASAVSAERSQAAQDELVAILREAHGLREGEEDDFRVRNQAELMETATQTSRVMTLLLGAVAGVSLIVGGIGIMNIMLVSVTERTREIGIRMAVGARGTDILVQFLTESVVLSLIGGLIGIGLALGVSWALERFAKMTTIVSPSVMLLAVGFAAAVGIFFGLYPARKAARLNPIEALRYE
jgi:putative ABC transport system permease protein